jgi:integrase/recombinase XerD
MGRGIAPSSMQRERSDLQTFYAWAKANRFVKKNPAKDLPKVSVPRGKPRPFTVQQIEAMLTSGAYRRTRIMIALGVYQGLRAHEIAKFAGTDIDLTSGTIAVTGKGGYDDVIPLHPVIEAIAPSMPDGYWFPGRGTNRGSHISYRSVSDLMTDAIRRAGITDSRLTGHSLRHTYGTELAEAGVDIRVVQELMRHRSLNSTQIYTRISERRKREGLASLPVVMLPQSSGRAA